MSNSNDWKFLLNRIERTRQVFDKLTEKCETTVKAMWLIEDEIAEQAKTIGVRLSPQQTFVLAYFRRNTIYLHSSYILAIMGFCYPSMNLQRTVYEAILRGYFFIVDPQEADLYYASLETNKEENFLKQRKRYGHGFLCAKLFKEGTKRKHRKLYKTLCISAHAEIRGLLRDFPAYRQKEIEDRLRSVLGCSYGNIQMVTEMFINSINSTLKKAIGIALKEIVISLENQVPVFEPDKDVHSSKLKLKKGNFMQIL